jgi:hypothetical protein
MLDSAFLLGSRPEVVLFAISIARLEVMSLELSNPVAEAVAVTARAVTDYLRDHPGSP